MTTKRPSTIAGKTLAGLSRVVLWPVMAMLCIKGEQNFIIDHIGIAISDYDEANGFIQSR